MTYYRNLTLIQWSRILYNKLIVAQLVGIFLFFYGTWMFIVIFTKELIPNLNRMDSVHMATSCFPNICFNIILLSSPRSDTWSHALWFVYFILYTFLISSMFVTIPVLPHLHNLFEIYLKEEPYDFKHYITFSVDTVTLNNSLHILLSRYNKPLFQKHNGVARSGFVFHLIIFFYMSTRSTIMNVV
jgi:hypothetical protein